MNLLDRRRAYQYELLAILHYHALTRSIVRDAHSFRRSTPSDAPTGREFWCPHRRRWIPYRPHFHLSPTPNSMQ